MTYEEQIEGLNEEIIDLENSNTKLEELLEESQNDLQNAHSQYENLKDENTLLQNRIDDLENKFDRYNFTVKIIRDSCE